jgi:mono/diheme cytochrome c family protein
MNGRLRSLVWAGAGILLGVLIFAVRPAAHALPEYAVRTGESCATCHVNPAGGGPRTLRGLLWAAQGKPDKVPPLPGSEERPSAPAAAPDDRSQYEKPGCAGCHGANGEGGVGPALTRTELTANAVTQVIRNGRGAMPALKPDVLSDEALTAIVRYVLNLGRAGAPAAAVQGQPTRQAPKLVCGAGQQGPVAASICGGN